MTAADSQPSGDLTVRGRPFWLPLRGTGNGLDAPAWAPILDQVNSEAAGELLALLAAAAIPAFVSGPGPDRAGRVTRPGHLWVDSTRYSRAEDLLMTHLRAAAHTTGDDPR